jgi:integrase
LALVRLRALSEAEAYARCYGEGDESVLSVKIEPRRPRLFRGVSGEDLRHAFETRLQSREPVQDTVAEVLGEAVPDSVSGAASNGHKPAAAA